MQILPTAHELHAATMGIELVAGQSVKLLFRLRVLRDQAVSARTLVVSNHGVHNR